MYFLILMEQFVGKVEKLQKRNKEAIYKVKRKWT